MMLSGTSPSFLLGCFLALQTAVSAVVVVKRQNPVLDDSQWQKLARDEGRVYCTVRPRKDGGDDGPAIVKALTGNCRVKGLVWLPGPIYNIKSAMTTVGMKDIKIVQTGRMLWSPDIEYWRKVAMPVGFQNQSTVWYFGGEDVVWDGRGEGTMDGNGQVWYDWAQGRGNLPQRPMNINIKEMKRGRLRGLRFVQSQMWTMAITHSHDVELDDIYVNSTSRSQWNTLNTDGCDTINSDRITFRRWHVSNGDDAIALKGNSTNIFIQDSDFYHGQGIAVGSMGQYLNRSDVISGLRVRNVRLFDTAHVLYVKTWSGTSRGFPPNGGGGGYGNATDIDVQGVRFSGMRQQPFFAWQCENYSGHAGEDCNSSTVKIRDMHFGDVEGTVVNAVTDVGSLQCSQAAQGCRGISASGINVKTQDGRQLSSWHCENVRDPVGFTCTTNK
ncbi:glycoside hydrolase family 28 [Ophiocordyceps camponoti-floridani]|uniref:Glycoside hydrolase family 28 n=1 Tax=Ophiocordyceps camponoti-floridani TaxID=2030778 RepID=A0A8H4Q853_9HYPO|nr:glycoside hydrolase family 28 [Ophiocordyceps camponoti-floridani]